QELICYDVCQENKWKTGVCDHINILHHGKQTLLQNRLFSSSNSVDGYETPIPLEESHAMAMDSYRKYFSSHLLKFGEFEELRLYGETYSYSRQTR
ncbi:MAG TPA: hypothetical protein VIK29_10235, partial [Paludibacter sp.]